MREQVWHMRQLSNQHSTRKQVEEHNNEQAQDLGNFNKYQN